MDESKPARLLNFGINSDSKTGAIMTKNGDTLWNIAKRYRLPLRSIIDLNGLTPPYRLANGQRLKMPAPVDYKVRYGDNLQAVANLFDVSLYQLVRTNNLTMPYKIRSGEYLRIPSKYEQYEENEQQHIVSIKIPEGREALIEKGALENLRKQDTSYEAEVLAPIAVERLPALVIEEEFKISEPRERPKDIIVSSSKNRGFMWPVKGKVISGYGAKSDGLYNEGVNIAVPKGAPVVSASDGVVAYIGGDLESYGNLVLIKHGGGMTTAYAHLDKIKVKKGQKVKKNQVIGAAGSTGNVASSQLHFEIRKGSKTYDPKKYL